MDENQERQHQKKKIIIRIIGSILLALGVVCAIIGFADMAKSFQEERMPKIWLFFIGFPSIAIGGFMLIVSFQRSIQRYVKNESVPVFNEMGQQVKRLRSYVPTADRQTKRTPSSAINAEKLLTTDINEYNIFKRTF